MIRRRKPLTHRVALVTGGARGIGRAVTEALLAEGLSVAIADRDEITAAHTARELGDRVRAYPLDVTDLDAFIAVVARVERDLGPVDVVVNNAGIMPLGAFLDQSPRSDRAQMDINVHGVIHGMRATLPGMLARGRGHVVNIASVAGRVPTPHAAVYAATKHAVVGLTEAVRAEHEGSGVAFTYVLPSLVDTELISGTGRLNLSKPVTPQRVARDLVSALHTGQVDVWVPRFTRIGQIIPAIAPRRLTEAVARLFGLDKLFAKVDEAGRQAYRDRIHSG